MDDSIELEDPKGTYNPTNATTLSSIFPLISFADYFASFTPRPAYPDPIIVTSPKYIGKMAQIVEDTEERVLEGYFAWKVIQSVRLPLPWPVLLLTDGLDWIIPRTQGADP